MTDTKELKLAIESLSLLLNESQSLGLDEFNKLNELAPFVAAIIARRLGTQPAKLRAYINLNGPIEFKQLKVDLLHQKTYITQ